MIPKRPAPDEADALSWVHHADGRYVFFLPRAEIGQNIMTGLKQVACAELGAAWDQVDARLPSSPQIRTVRATVGSDSIKDYALPLAQACATLRDALAAGRTQGVLQAEARPFAALRAWQPGAPCMGRDMPIEQGEAIVRGQPLYVADVRRPQMMFGRVLRAPASPELKSVLARVDEAAARAVAGFVVLVRDPLLALGSAEGLGIVARTPAALDRVEAALAAGWHTAGGFEQADIDVALDIDRRLKSSASLAHKVHADAIDRDSPWDVDMRIEVPVAAHSPLQPRAAVAAVTGDSAEVWAGTQDLFYVRDVIARRLGLAPERVVVHGHRVGGAFGGKTLCTVELEAAVLSRAVGQAVKVQWSRAQEFRHGFHRPPSSHRVRARLKDGRIDQWWHAFASSHILFTNAAMPPWMQRVADFIGDAGVARGADPPYRARARRVDST